MIEGWELSALRASELWDAAVSNDYAVPIVITVSLILSINVVAAWSLRRTLRRSEKRLEQMLRCGEDRLAETLRQDIRQEFERRRRSKVNNLSKLADAAAGVKSKSSNHDMMLSEPLDDEGSSIEKILSSMRRVKKRNVRTHAPT